MPPRAPIGGVPLFDSAEGVTLLRPEVDAPGYWVGAPALWLDGETLYMSVRWRRPLDEGRGWKSEIYVLRGGAAPEPVWACTAEQFDSESIERCALVRVPDGAWRYYVSYLDPADRRWRIDLLEADELSALDPARRTPVLDAANTFSEGVKDPVVLLLDGLFYLFAGYGPRDRVADGATAEQLHGTGNVFTTGLVDHPTGLWVSADGRRFGFERDIVTPGDGWDANVTRVSTDHAHRRRLPDLLRRPHHGEGDVYEDRTGMVFSQDLSATVRYSTGRPATPGPRRHPLPALYGLRGAGRFALFYVYETSTDAGAHELRASRVPASVARPPRGGADSRHPLQQAADY